MFCNRLNGKIQVIIPACFVIFCCIVCYGAQKLQDAPLKVIQLDPPRLDGPVSLEQTLVRRRSVRRFSRRQLDFEQIGQLAWAGQGITDKRRGFRTAPSAGTLYPMTLYFATQEGLFVYHPHQHSLEQILDYDIRGRLAGAALGQSPVAQAGCDIIVAGFVEKLAVKYRDKAFRYMLMEAGHIAQNIQLQAVSLELGAVTIGAFEIAVVRKVCQLPDKAEPIYIISVGYPAEKTE